MLDHVAFGDRPANARSKVTNGVRLFLKGTTDGRSCESRRFHDLCAAYAKDFGTTRGLNEAEKTVIRNAAVLSLRSEQLQADLVSGRDVHVEEMVRLANASARLLKTLQRGRAPPRAEQPHVSLRDRLAQKYPRAAP